MFTRVEYRLKKIEQSKNKNVKNSWYTHTLLQDPSLSYFRKTPHFKKVKYRKEGEKFLCGRERKTSLRRESGSERRPLRLSA